MTAKLDKFHYHELSDRLYMIENIVHDYLLEHPVTDKHEDIWKMIFQADQCLANAYQMMAKYK